MGCTFCATGAMGIRRNLSAGEIVGQVLALVLALGPARPHAVTLVFMGMGEPLHNLDNVHRAIRILNHPAGLNISTRRITVSTVGVLPALLEFGRAGLASLAGTAQRGALQGLGSASLGDLF